MPRCALCHRRLAARATCPADGARASATSFESYVGDSPPGFAECSVLGVGGFATTWRVRDSADQVHALKWARRSSSAARERFEHEAEILRMLGSSPSPALVESGVLEGRPYLLMDEIQGPTLGKLLEELSEPLPEISVRSLASSLVAAVDLLHGSGVVHRDLKPDNIFAQPQQVRLIDFGLAAQRRQVSDTESAAAGTPEYAAPEQMRDGSVSTAGDVYSVGVIIYELVTQRLPFLGENMSLEYEHTNLRPPSPSRFAKLSGDLETIILQTLNKDPARRPTTAELLSRLSGSEATVHTTPRRAQGRVKSQRAMAILLAASDVSLSVTELDLLATEFGAQVVSYREGEALLAWMGQSVSRPIEEAEALAKRLEEKGGRRLCLHLEQVKLLPRPPSPSLLFGAAVEPGASWRPEGAWHGLLKSSALAETQTRQELSAPFVGREFEIQKVLRVAGHCFADRRPSIVTFFGGPGEGKSRLLEEAASRLADFHLELRTLVIDGESSSELERGENLMDQAASGPLCLLADDLGSLPTELLDALEYATLSTAALPILLLCTASTNLRPRWGTRAGASERIDIQPLHVPESRRLFEALLHPATYIPDRALDQLAAASSGHVGACFDLAATLHRDGYLLQQGEGRYQLDTARLESLPPQSIHQWVASAQVAHESPPMARLLSLCALLPDGFSDELVISLVDTLAASDESNTGWPDASVALAQWRHRDLLHFDGSDYRFPIGPIRDALGQMCNEQEALRWHRTALSYWQRSTHAKAQERCAHHAQACGETQIACDAWISLGREAMRCHRPVDADRAYAAALQDLPSSAKEARLKALCGSGWALYRMDRSAESVARLLEASQLAVECGDSRTQIWSLLESATALDWAQRFDESAAKVEAAHALSESSKDTGLQHRLSLGRGRSAWRAQQIDQAIPLLEDAADAAAARGDFDCRVVALILLAPALVLHRDLKQAEARFTEVIELCRGASDLLHLCAAYGNRIFLWSALKNTEAAQSDLREAMRLARQVGHPGPERVATYNLAEDIYWSGEDDAHAHELAEQAWGLAKKFLDFPVVEDALLVARTALALERPQIARDALSWARAELPAGQWSEAANFFGEMIEKAIEPASVKSWQELLERARPLLGADDHLEIRYWFLRSLGDKESPAAADLLADARAPVDENPIWRRRYEQLGL